MQTQERKGIEGKGLTTETRLHKERRIAVAERKGVDDGRWKRQGRGGFVWVWEVHAR